MSRDPRLNLPSRESRIDREQRHAVNIDLDFPSHERRTQSLREDVDYRLQRENPGRVNLQNPPPRVNLQIPPPRTAYRSPSPSKYDRSAGNQSSSRGDHQGRGRAQIDTSEPPPPRIRNESPPTQEIPYQEQQHYRRGRSPLSSTTPRGKRIAPARSPQSASPPSRSRREAPPRDRNPEAPGPTSSSTSRSFVNIRTPSPPVLTISPPPLRSSAEHRRSSPRPKRQRQISPSIDKYRSGPRNMSSSGDKDYHRSGPRMRSPSNDKDYGRSGPRNRSPSVEQVPSRNRPRNRSPSVEQVPSMNRQRQRSPSVEQIPSKNRQRQKSPSVEKVPTRNRQRQRSPSIEHISGRHRNKQKSPGIEPVSSGSRTRQKSPYHDHGSNRARQRSPSIEERPGRSSPRHKRFSGEHRPSRSSTEAHRPAESGTYDPEDSLREITTAQSVIGMSGIAREGASYPNIHERITERAPQFDRYANPEPPPAATLYPQLVPPQDENWAQFLEREKKKEELLRQYQAGLLVANIPSSRPVISENSSSDNTNDMAESILKLIMEKGLKNESNIAFLRTREMRGVLKRIFSKELAENKSSSDRGFLQSLKNEIKEEPGVEEVILSSGDENEPKTNMRKQATDLGRKSKSTDREAPRKSKPKERETVVDHTRDNLHKHRSRSPGVLRKKHTSSSGSRSRSRSPGKTRKHKKNKHRSHQKSPGPSSKKGNRQPPDDLINLLGEKRRNAYHARKEQNNSKSKEDHQQGIDKSHCSKDNSSTSRQQRSDYYGHHDKDKSSKNDDKSEKHQDPSRKRHLSKHSDSGHIKESPKVSLPLEDSSILMKIFATVVGFIDASTAILQITSKGSSKDQLVVLNKSNLWIKKKVVMQAAITCIKPVGNDPIEELIPLGTGVALNARKLSEDVFQYQAITVWPAIAEEPEYSYNFSKLTKEMEEFRTNFKLFDFEPLTFDGIKPATADNWTALVEEILSDDWGVLLLSRENKRSTVTNRFSCFFNKDCVWTKEGRLANLPLKEVINVGQSVNLVCRSVVTVKGLDLYKNLLKRGIQLQALVVSLDKYRIPEGAPRGLQLEAVPGTFCQSARITSYLFNRDLINKLDYQFQNFLKDTGKKISSLDEKLLNFTVTVQPEKEKDDTKSKLKNALGKIKRYCFGDAGYIESLDGKWTCSFHSNECFLPSNQNYKNIYKENFLVTVYAQQVNVRRKAQYVAQKVVNAVNSKAKEVINFEFYPPTDDQLHNYAQVNNVLEGRPPSHQKEYYDMTIGQVTHIVSKNYGIICFDDDKKALFKNTDVWLTATRPSSSAEHTSKILPIGTQVTLNCVMLNSTGKVQYLATAVWKCIPCPFPVGSSPQADRMSSLPNEKIVQFRDQVSKIQFDLDKHSTPPAEQTVSVQTCSGRVKFTCIEIGHSYASGGILEFNISPDRPFPVLAAFCLKNFPAQMADTLSQIGCFLSFEAVPIMSQDGYPVTTGITHIADQIQHASIKIPKNLKDKIVENTKNMLELMEHKNNIQFLDNRQTPKLRYGSFFGQESVPPQTQFTNKPPNQPPPPGISDQPMPPGVPDIPMPLMQLEENLRRLPPNALELESGTGAVACILNENFGLVQFRTSDNTDGYGLFDTYDLYIGPNSKASDYSMDICKFVNVNDEVRFHGVEVDSRLHVSWQITAIWKGIPNFIAPSVPSDTITESKIDVFRQVVDSCEDQIIDLEREKLVPGTPAFQRNLQIHKYRVPNILNDQQDPVFGRKPPPQGGQGNWPQNPQHLGDMRPRGPFPHPSWGARGPHPWGPRGPPPPHMMGRPPFGHRGILPLPFMMRGPGGPPWGPGGPMRGPVPRPSGFGRPRLPTAVAEAVNKHVTNEESINAYGNFFKDKPITDDDTNTDDASKVSIVNVDGGVARKRFKELEEIKKGESFVRYKKMRMQDTEGTKRIPEPDPASAMSAGAWEDAIRKWKLQVNQLVKQGDTGTKTLVEKDGGKSADKIQDGDGPETVDNELPITLADASTVGEIVDIYDSTTAIIKLSKVNEYAFLDTSRIWKVNHKLFEGLGTIKAKYNNKVNIYAKRIFTPGPIKYQGIYAHVGLPRTSLGTFKYADKMAKFIKECQSAPNLQSELDTFLRKCKNKAPL